MKILFISTHNLATNPRLVKEIRLALDHNFSVEIICFDFDNWSSSINEKMKSEFSNVRMICIPAGRKPFLPWFLSVVNEQISRKLNLLFSTNRILANAVSRRSRMIIKNLKNVSRPDLIIGHNPGALYPTKVAAARFNCKGGFDIEDYHPGEGNNKFLQQITKRLMQKMLPGFNYVSFASPSIRDAVKRDFGKEGNWVTTFNYFPGKEFIYPQKPEGKLKLVWFSQNISYNRGLEEIIPVIKDNEEVELHLYGNCNEAFENEWIGSVNILLHPSLPQEILHAELSKFDIGLAIEPGKDLNNELALSNKILTYFQCGLFILASNTTAQTNFIYAHPEHGSITSLSYNDLNETIQNLIKEKKSLRAGAAERFENAKAFCWENESQKLLRLWEEMV